MYAQALSTSTNTKKILKIKEIFLNLQANKIKNIQKIINNDGKPKPKLNMTTKSILRKQVIILMSNENKLKFMELLSAHITNLNRALKNIKFKVMADQANIIIVTNKVALLLDLQTIKKYVKNTNHIKADKVKVPHLSQSKSYLKIIGIFYMLENTNTPITADIVKFIIKSNHIFNNIMITSRSHIIKVSLKSDIVIIWLDIWNVQSGSNTKDLINRYFNVGSYIATICRTNINLGVP